MPLTAAVCGVRTTDKVTMAVRELPQGDNHEVALYSSQLQSHTYHAVQSR